MLVKNCRVYLSRVYLASLLGVTPLNLAKIFGLETSFHGLSYGVVCVIRRLAVLVELLTCDRQTDGHSVTATAHAAPA